MNRQCEFEAPFGGDALAVSGDREPSAGDALDDEFGRAALPGKVS